MSSFMGWKKNSNSGGTPGASPTSSSPLNSTISNANSVSGLGPLGSTNNTSTSSLSTFQPIQIVNSNNNSPPLSSSSTPNSMTSTPSSQPSTPNNYSNDTIGKSSSAAGASSFIDTSQFNNNYVSNVFGGRPIDPNTEFGSSILNKFSKYLLNKGFNTDGIFKHHPELENEIQNVKKNLIKDLSIGDMEQASLSTLTQNPLVIGELMKQYLAKLPEPLFSYQLYDSFLLTHSILSPTDRIWAYRFLLLYLPVGFRGAIKSVLGLLTKIHQCSESSKMNSESLAKIFSPVFLRPEEDMYYMKSDQSTLEEIVKLWIEEFDLISKPPTNPNPNSKVTILSSANSLSQFQQQAFQHSSLPNISALSSNLIGQQFQQQLQQQQQQQNSHPTIGMNKVSASSSNLQLNLQTPKSPKLLLPTIPKDDQQQMTIVKQKPILSSNNKPTPTSTPTLAPQPPTNSVTNTITSSLLDNGGNITPNSSPSINKRLSLSGGLALSPPGASLSEQEVEEKVRKIKVSIDSVVSEQALLQIRNLLKSIEKEFNYNHIIKFSSIIRDAKKHMNESSEKQLSLTKTNIREFIQEYPKPLSYNLLVSSIPKLDTTNFTEQEKKANDLKRASQVAADEISDYIYYYKLKISTFQLKEQVISTAQILSKLKSILESPPPSLPTGSSWSDFENSQTNQSPNSSPLMSRLKISNSSGNVTPPQTQPPPTENQISADKATIRIIEVCSQEIKSRFETMRTNLERVDINGAFEIGKHSRNVKAVLNDIYVQCKLTPPPDIKALPPGEDQLTTLRRALPPLFDRFITQVDELTQHVFNNKASPEEITIIVDKLLFINRSLSM
ncbi:hypothetical protein RB653_008288 [Dictyostelium firmibasis]|uniref:Rho-GAP domain-containing protein n=1 Tax=Dictyostelium firmibasis TaxID=79012 RepID=A0AAN7YTW3_9MYCE